MNVKPLHRIIFQFVSLTAESSQQLFNNNPHESRNPYVGKSEFNLPETGSPHTQIHFI